jgi:hypothetical protein
MHTMNKTNGARGNTPVNAMYQAAVQNSSLAEAQQRLRIEDLPGLLVGNPHAGGGLGAGQVR